MNKSKTLNKWRMSDTILFLDHLERRGFCRTNLNTKNIKAFVLPGQSETQRINTLYPDTIYLILKICEIVVNFSITNACKQSPEAARFTCSVNFSESVCTPASDTPTTFRLLPPACWLAAVAIHHGLAFMLYVVFVYTKRCSSSSSKLICWKRSRGIVMKTVAHER